MCTSSACGDWAMRPCTCSPVHGPRVLLSGTRAQGAGEGVGIEHEVVGVHGGQEPERVPGVSSPVPRERRDDRVVGALVGIRDGLEESPRLVGAAQARVRGEERVVREGVADGYLVEHPAGVAESAEPRVSGHERVEEEGLAGYGRLQNARVRGSGAGEVRRGAEEVGQRRRRTEVRDELLASLLIRAFQFIF